MRLMRPTPTGAEKANEANKASAANEAIVVDDANSTAEADGVADVADEAKANETNKLMIQPVCWVDEDDEPTNGQDWQAS